MKKGLIVVAAVIISSSLSAQQDSAKVLDEAVVTASKFEQKQSTTGKVVTIITKEQLERSGGKTLAQVLNEQAGVVINGALNNLGSVQTIFTRGASTGRTLILVDGVPMYDPTMIYNEGDLNLFSVNEVERIEVCKGAQSTLYGSDAVAGVINIITVKKDINKAFNVKATMSYGNRNTTRNNVQLYGKIKKLTYTTRFARLNTNGFSSAYDSTRIKKYDNDKYDGKTSDASLQYQLLPSLSLRSFVQYTDYRSDIDASIFNDDKDYRIHNTTFATGAGVNFKKGILNITANYQYREIDRKYLNDSLHVAGFNKYERNNYWGRTQYAELYGNVKIAPWLTVLAGSDYRWGNMNQRYFSLSSFGPFSSSFNDTAMHQTSVYGSVFLSFLDKKLNIEGGARYNDHSKYGDNTTYTFNPSYTISKNWRVFGSVASGFKTPSLFQLFDAGSGNPDLKAETSTNYEGGVQFLNAKINTRAVYFHRKINNGIDFNYIDFVYFNFIKQEVDGLELEIKALPIAKLDINANYTLVVGQEQTQSRKNFHDTTYNYLIRRPKHVANVSIGYQFCKQFYASVNSKYVSERYDVGGYQKEDVLLKSYFILGAYAEYKVKDYLKLFADAQNITDKRFFDIRGYNAIPFLINGGITFTW
jgi:vitamin B12 transporter